VRQIDFLLFIIREKIAIICLLDREGRNQNLAGLLLSLTNVFEQFIHLVAKLNRTTELHHVQFTERSKILPSTL